MNSGCFPPGNSHLFVNLKKHLGLFSPLPFLYFSILNTEKVRIKQLTEHMRNSTVCFQLLLRAT